MPWRALGNHLYTRGVQSGPSSGFQRPMGVAGGLPNSSLPRSLAAAAAVAGGVVMGREPVAVLDVLQENTPYHQTTTVDGTNRTGSLR